MDRDENPSCYACGVANPIGLHLRFEKAGEGVTAEFVPSVLHQGYEGIIHGGIIATLLDEAMAHALLAQGIVAVTARLKVKFGAALSPGVQVTVRGLIRENRGRIIEAASEITAESRMIASAEAIFMAKPSRRR